MRVVIFLGFLALVNAATVRREKTLRANLHASSTASRFKMEGSNEIGRPVHEMIVHLTMKKAYPFPSTSFTGDEFDDPSLIPYLRGNFWNDDPSGDLFDWNDDCQETWNFSGGAVFLGHVWSPCASSSNHLYCRSHYGNLSFLHGMATDVCVCPADIRSWMLRWADMTANCAANRAGFHACTTTTSVYSAGVQMKSFFSMTQGHIGAIWLSPKEGMNVCSCPAYQNLPGSSSWPHCGYGSMQLAGGRRRWWAVGWCRCKPPGSKSKNWDCPNCGAMKASWYQDTRKRAVGSLLHMIEDSFAFGHTTRGDSDSAGSRFRGEDRRCQSTVDEGAPASETTDKGQKNCGSIWSMNAYGEQNGDEDHDEYDFPGADLVTVGGGFTSWTTPSHVLCDGCTASRITYVNGQLGCVESIYAGVIAVKQTVRLGQTWSTAKTHYEDNVWRLVDNSNTNCVDCTYAAGGGMGANPPDQCGSCPNSPNTGDDGKPHPFHRRRRRDPTYGTR